MAGSPSVFVVKSTRGGVNLVDSPMALGDDQCTAAANCEWTQSMLGERRRGLANIDLTGSGLDGGGVSIAWLFRYLPTNDESAAELFAMGFVGPTATLARKNTAWHPLAYVDAADTVTDPPTAYQYSAVSLHGKLFIAMDTFVDRLHVWDGSILRRTGLNAPAAAPTAVDTGGGTFSGTRYYRVRWTVRAVPSGKVLLRSEPSPVLAKIPSGAGAGLQVSRPADDSEPPGSTHWELEASTDNINFYVIATPTQAVTFGVDVAPFATGYSANPLSPDILDYALLGSARYLLADEDRLILLGSYEDATLDSRMAWTPVFGGPGAGNDERFETDTDPFVDVNGVEGGRITGGGGPLNGVIYLFKRHQIYRAVRTGDRAQAYQVLCWSKTRGALEGSIAQGVDEAGRPCLYFWDPEVGPCRIGANGLQWCGADIYPLAVTVNVDATTLPMRALYYPTKQQMIWWFATGASNVPNVCAVLHVALTTIDPLGNVRKGWAIWDGPYATATAVCLFSSNIDAGVARNHDMVPFLGRTGFVSRGDTGTDDAGTAYVASLTTRPVAPGTILNQAGVMAGALLGTSGVGTVVDVTVTRDFGLESKTVTASLAPVGSETYVRAPLDNLALSEAAVLQVTFGDTPGHSALWALHQFAAKVRPEQTA
jgi:hypothetical protein